MLNTNNNCRKYLILCSKASAKLCTVAICNVYFPGPEELNSRLLEDLLQQLTQTVIVMGDFKAHNVIWGSWTTDAGGRAIETLINNDNSNIMNNAVPTRVTSNSETAMDLTFCTASISVDWNVAASPGIRYLLPSYVYHPEKLKIERTKSL